MRRHDLVELLRAQPFKPFRVYVSDGGTYVVRHPDVVLVSPSSAVVGTSEGEQSGPVVERFSILDLDHVTRVELLEEATK